jgi:hypothetical protein
MIANEVCMDIKAMFRSGLSIRKITRTTGLHGLNCSGGFQILWDVLADLNTEEA